MRKDGGLEIIVLNDPEEILRLYTPEVHALYWCEIELIPIRKGRAGRCLRLEYLY